MKIKKVEPDIAVKADHDLFVVFEIKHGHNFSNLKKKTININVQQKWCILKELW